ncbi:histone deacetylase family protein [Dokdonella sp.]|uniref:histone deacetylase family protein n=1 Tax=Dokdonella sp. TaxID=2291710 RepID=UPI003784AD11
MSVALYTHASCLAHDPGPGHPESPARLAAVLDALDAPRFAALDRRQAPRATRAQLERVHRADLVDDILSNVPATGWCRLDADTVMSPASAEAALRAAGAACAAVDAVLTTPLQRAFCAVRPPGHHATPSSSMGFCLFNNVAVAAAQALAVHRLERVAIVDFDVHHGNGTQDIFWSDARVLYASSHQWPLYPGTGARGDTGAGNIVNAPLPAGAGSIDFRDAFNRIVLPALDEFAPQLIFISAGFDAHRLDPLAGLELEADDYAWVTRRLLDLARRHAQGRVVSSLEGGYDLGALAESSAAHVGAMLG